MVGTLRHIKWRAVLNGVGALIVINTLLAFVLPSPWPVMLALVAAIALTSQVAGERKAFHSVVMVLTYVVGSLVLLYALAGVLTLLGY